MVLDAKYKPDPFGRDDVHQLISYLHALQAPAGAFIVPQGEDKEYSLAGFGGKLGSLALALALPEQFSGFADCLQALDACARDLGGRVDRICSNSN